MTRAQPRPPGARAHLHLPLNEQNNHPHPDTGDAILRTPHAATRPTHTIELGVPKTISLSTASASYDITVGAGLLRTLHPRLKELAPNRRPFLITSPNIWSLWSKPVRESFPEGRHPTVLFVPPGEQYKRLAHIESLANQLAQHGADRDALLLAFGGGVVGDVTGFLAAIYMRGIPYVQLPTTLLAQVDSSVGGKTGVNLVAGKNLLGAFHHPLAVLADIDTLATLPPRELRAGPPGIRQSRHHPLARALPRP